jgi:hypothetical protein
MSLVFDGVQNLATIPDSPAVRPSTGITVAIWLYRTASTAYQFPHVFIKQYAAGGNGLENMSWALATEDDLGQSYDARIRFADSYAGGEIRNEPDHLGQWVLHVLSWQSGGSRKYFTYGANGVLIGSHSAGTITSTIPYDSGDLLLGMNPTSLGGWPGKMGHFAIWDRELTIVEREALAAGALPSEYASGLLSYWPLVDSVERHTGSHDVVLTGATFDANDNPPVAAPPPPPLDTPVVTIASQTNPTTIGGNDGSATVQWGAVTGAASYDVGRAAGLGQTEGFTVLQTGVTALEYADNSGLAAGDYTYGVRAQPPA